jgi:polyhydroxyalkanoate synthesis repressor PhaR
VGDKLLIKKYSNRRLYDTEKSAYVSLNQVADAIRQGRQVEVLDAKTHEDVTACILTQIILEEARKKNILLPLPLLHLTIRYGETVLSEFFEKYLQQVIKNYLAYKSAVDDQFRRWLDLGLDFSARAHKAMSDLSPFHPFLDLFANGSQETGREREDL